ncbi:MAG TPA: DUF3175 domain-containing protein [Anaeromyxobacter sp.]
MVRRATTRRRQDGRTARAGERPRRYWSRDVTRHSNALDLESRVFKLPPREMARSLKRSSDRSTRRKSSPFRSAMSMLTFFENRAGRNLSPARKQAIHKAKEELRKLYGRRPQGA